MKSEPTLITNDFSPVFDECSRILILGSLPSVASREAGFYYMNPHNRFWKMLSILFGEPFPAMTKDEKISALLSRGIALYDVARRCEIRSSSDASIKNVECADIHAILERSKIEKILLNGKTAYSLFIRFFPEFSSLALPMPSTSPANAKLSLSDLALLWGKELL